MDKQISKNDNHLLKVAVTDIQDELFHSFVDGSAKERTKLK